MQPTNYSKEARNYRQKIKMNMSNTENLPIPGNAQLISNDRKNTLRRLREKKKLFLGDDINSLTRPRRSRVSNYLPQ